MTMEPSLLDTDTLSEVMKGVNQGVQSNARQYLRAFGSFTFSLITRYEILRGLKARRATRQIARFEQRCQQSVVLPVTDAIIVRAADVYALLHQEGQLISDADILIAATALEHSLVMMDVLPGMNAGVSICATPSPIEGSRVAEEDVGRLGIEPGAPNAYPSPP